MCWNYDIAHWLQLQYIIAWFCWVYMYKFKSVACSRKSVACSRKSVACSRTIMGMIVENTCHPTIVQSVKFVSFSYCSGGSRGGGHRRRPSPYFRQILLKNPLNWLKFTKNFGGKPQNPGRPTFFRSWIRHCTGEAASHHFVNGSLWDSQNIK